MKILIVTHSFSPDLTPRAFRWAAIASRLGALGHEVHVLCATQSGAPEDRAFKVHRVADPVLKARPVAAPAPVVRDESASWRATLKSWSRYTFRALWRSFYWPDYACGWIFPAARMARSLAGIHRFDWVITTSHPFSGHMVWWLVRRAYAPPRWLVDIGDPYALMKQPSPYNRHFYALLSYWVEKRLIARADRISVTTDATASLYRSSFSAGQNRIAVIPPVMSLPAPPSRTRQEDGVIDLVFVGTLYRNLRSPRYLLECFRVLSERFQDGRFRLHFYGAVNDCQDILAEYADHPHIIVVVHGLVDRAIVLHAMANADVLVNIGNHSASQLGSKVIEYMAMGRPILNVISIADDISLAVLSSYPSCFTMSAGTGTISGEEILQLENFLQNPPTVPPDFAENVRRLYSAEEIARKYLALMSDDLPGDSADGNTYGDSSPVG